MCTIARRLNTLYQRVFITARMARCHLLQLMLSRRLLGTHVGRVFLPCFGERSRTLLTLSLSPSDVHTQTLQQPGQHVTRRTEGTRALVADNVNIN